MSENENEPLTRRQKVDRDVDVIGGFFGTRAGGVVTVVLLGGGFVLLIVGKTFGWW